MDYFTKLQLLNPEFYGYKKLKSNLNHAVQIGDDDVATTA